MISDLIFYRLSNENFELISSLNGFSVQSKRDSTFLFLYNSYMFADPEFTNKTLLVLGAILDHCDNLTCQNEGACAVHADDAHGHSCRCQGVYTGKFSVAVTFVSEWVYNVIILG